MREIRYPHCFEPGTISFEIFVWKAILVSSKFNICDSTLSKDTNCLKTGSWDARSKSGPKVDFDISHNYFGIFNI